MSIVACYAAFHVWIAQRYAQAGCPYIAQLQCWEAMRALHYETR